MPGLLRHAPDAVECFLQLGKDRGRAGEQQDHAQGHFNFTQSPGFHVLPSAGSVGP